MRGGRHCGDIQGKEDSFSVIFRALLLFHSHGRGIWTVERSGFGLRTELGFGIGWNEGVCYSVGDSGGGVGSAQGAGGTLWP